tara:strand:- start:974 stop:1465 length:492 start_codon:yes stop_codon:yes gene_type:complete
MVFIKKEFFLLIFFILLQSCSGGRIGNFLESSFNDLEKTSQNGDSLNYLENKNALDDNKDISSDVDVNDEKGKQVEEPKFVMEKKKDQNLEKVQKKKNDKIKNPVEEEKFESESYKIILILKNVDPKYPTEDLSTILRNSEVNFEIEKIERILDSKNKSINKN